MKKTSREILASLLAVNNTCRSFINLLIYHPTPSPWCLPYCIPWYSSARYRFVSSFVQLYKVQRHECGVIVEYKKTVVRAEHKYINIYYTTPIITILTPPY